MATEHPSHLWLSLLPTQRSKVKRFHRYPEFLSRFRCRPEPRPQPWAVAASEEYLPRLLSPKAQPVVLDVPQPPSYSGLAVRASELLARALPPYLPSPPPVFHLRSCATIRAQLVACLSPALH